MREILGGASQKASFIMRNYKSFYLLHQRNSLFELLGCHTGIRCKNPPHP